MTFFPHTLQLILLAADKHRLLDLMANVNSALKTVQILND